LGVLLVIDSGHVIVPMILHLWCFEMYIIYMSRLLQSLTFQSLP